MKSKYKRIDFDRVRTYQINERKSKVSKKMNCKVLNNKSSINDLLNSLPDVLIGKDFKRFVEQTRRAISEKNTIILMMGAHLIKCGLSPLIIELLKQKKISHLAVNGATVIHDLELALYGKTSEDVQSGLNDGTFGMCRTTADYINTALTDNYSNDLGYGECIAKKMDQNKQTGREVSIIYECYKNEIPVSVHSAIGTEIIHQHPSFDGKAYGKKSLIDFKIFTHSLSNLRKNSIVINIGSAVIMPEVFLKGLTVVRNLKYDCFGFHTAIFDMIKHYRPEQNVQKRPTQLSGEGYYFISPFELILPLFFGLIT